LYSTPTAPQQEKEESMRTGISKSTIGLGIFIIISSLFMNQVARFMEDAAGERGVEVMLGALFLIGLAIFVYSLLKEDAFTVYSALCIAVLLSGIILAWQVKNPAERIHVVEYGLLGWLASRDFTRKDNGITGLFKGCLFGLVVGIIDEVVQWILPYRIFDIRDIAFNGLGACWGALIFGLYALKKNKKALL
jgi:hypothetical protein